MLFFGLNMFFVSQLSVKIGISRSSKLWSNLVPQLQNCMNLVLLTQFC